MRKATLFLTCLAVVTIAAGLTGCGDGDKEAKKLTPTEEKIQKAMAQLPEADQAAAKAQKTCPVTDEALGSMGTPLKHTVTDAAGQQHVVFVCCPACKESIDKEPDTYLAKLNK